jgi:N-acetylglucosamine kinase-like BadF-type ATPase
MEILEQHMQNFVLGIDGGASKTAGALTDGSGRRIAQARLGGSAMIGRPAANVLECLSSLLNELTRQAGISKAAIDFAGLGMNGIDLRRDHPVQLADISHAIGIDKRKIKLVNDGVAALWGATSQERAAMIQFGSGFTAALRPAFGAERPFDHLDMGRIFDPRSEVIHLVQRMIDGRFPESGLKSRLLKHFGVHHEQDFAESIFSETVTKAQRVSTAPLIFQMWLEQDPGAVWLIDRMIDDFAACSTAMLKTTGAAELCLGGGVLLNAPQRFWDALANRIVSAFPGVKIQRPALPPELGACIMAAHATGTAPVDYFNRIAGQTTSPAK